MRFNSMKIFWKKMSADQKLSAINSSEETIAQGSEDDERLWKPTKRQWFAILVPSFAVFAVSLDSTILTVALPTIAESLSAKTFQSFWIVEAYLLASAVVQSSVASIAEFAGPRVTFITAMILFMVGSIICCTASNISHMIVGRTIQGLGGGGILSVNLIILTDIVPLRQRPRYLGLIQLINSVAINLGPIIGGFLVKISWRWIFYINFPFCGLGLITVPFALRSFAPRTEIFRNLKKVDWIGSLVFAAGTATLLVGISWGGVEYKWDSMATLLCLCVGTAAIFMSALYERYSTSIPFLRFSLFRNGAAIAAYLCTLLQSLTLFATSYFLILYLLTVKLYTPLLSGVVFLAYGLAVVPVSAFTGHMITSIGSYRWAIIWGWVIHSAGVGGLMTLTASTYVPGMLFLLVIAGTGQGLLFISHQAACQALCLPCDSAYASSMFSFVRSLGFCFGITIGGTAFQNFLSQALQNVGVSSNSGKAFETFYLALHAMPEGLKKEQLIIIFTTAFRHLWAVVCATSCVGLVLGLFLISDDGLRSKR
ncbi:hypothetical protein M433DRAFT_113479 [Acidomyces richmondensis BFW]|nr:hypothetical protein M433DRAFT_113479 [Acidomyces richmondensis BFW]